jgi:hypothetical protein
VNGFISIRLKETGGAEETHGRLRDIVSWDLDHTKHALGVHYGPHNMAFSLNAQALCNTLEAYPDRSLPKFTNKVITTVRDGDARTGVPNHSGSAFLAHGGHELERGLESHSK